MFGHNEVVGRKFFREHPEAQAGKLLVTSIFRTLQGEGPFAGCPAVFVRLAHCNLQCSFCDTFFDAGDWFDFDALLDAIEDLTAPHLRPRELLVMTGGEPTLQPMLGDFLRHASAAGRIGPAQIETNGLIAADVPATTTVVMSPKCSHPHDSRRKGAGPRYLRPPGPSLERANCLKFVISGDSSSPYYEIPEWTYAWARETGREVFISPMAEYNRPPEEARALYEARRAPSLAARSGAETISFWEPGLLDMAACRRNYEHAARYALMHGLRLSIQQHLFASLP